MLIFWIMEILSIVVLLIPIFLIFVSLDSVDSRLGPIIIISSIAVALSYIFQFLAHYLGGA